MFKYTVRKANLCDLDDICNVHKKVFSGYFTSSLGNGFLTLYYQAYIELGQYLFVAIDDNNKCIGFVSATTDTANFYKQLKKKLFFGFYRFLSQALTPSNIIRCIRKCLSLTFRNKINTSVDLPDRICEVTSLAVMEQQQGRGIGKSLLAKCIDSAFAERYLGIALTTDKNQNEKVINFYSNMGFKVHQVFSQDRHREMLLMILKRQGI